jgi:hypothetical protein
MTTKKILIIVVAIVLVVGLIVVVFVGGIIGVAFYSIGRSEAAETARSYLRTNERLKQDIGEIKDFGKIVTGNVQINNGSGTATINIKVIGERQTVNASVDLIYRNGRPWQVTAASYEDNKGQTIELLNPYKGQQLLPRLILKVAA